MADESEPKFCPTEGCGKKLRRNNRRGKCSACANGVKRHLNGGAGPKFRRVTPPPVADGGGQADLEKFRIVADALGYDADQLLAQLAGAWLEQVRDRIQAGA